VRRAGQAPGPLPSGAVPLPWLYLDEGGNETAGPDETFSDQAEAESWFTTCGPSCWRAACTRSPCSTAAEVYGPMSLHEPA